MTETTFAILEAPSRLGLSSPGVETLPKALLGEGLAKRLGASRAGEVTPPPHVPEIDRETGVLNLEGIASYTVDLANAIEKIFAAGDVPVVLGGDCSILLGCLLAMRRRGRSGLLFLDGHADFFQPAAEPKGEVASMELAIATGWHDTKLADPEGLKPLVREEDVVAFGRRDEQDSDESGSQRIEDSGVKLISLTDIRRDGIASAVAAALAHLKSHKHVWLHLDADVLDARIMPAVDHIVEGGLDRDELVFVLRQAFASGRIVGMDVTILNPTLDKDGSIVRRFVETLVAGLKPN